MLNLGVNHDIFSSLDKMLCISDSDFRGTDVLVSIEAIPGDHFLTTYSRSLSIEKNQMLEIFLFASLHIVSSAPLSCKPPANWPKAVALRHFSVNQVPNTRLESEYSCTSH